MRVYPELTVDGEFKALSDLGHTGALNDRQFSFLRGEGYVNALADMFGQYDGAVAFSPSTLFALAEPGVWYDPSDLTTLFQDTAGTTPVTTPGQTVALALDKSKGLVLGSEQKASGTIALVGTAPAANYNTTTGVGSVTRVDSSNQSFIQWSALSANSFYRVDISCQTNAVILRTGTQSGTSVQTVSAGQSVSVVVPSDSSGRIAITNTTSASTSTFTVSSVKELPGFHATQATLASRPTYGIVPLGGRRNLLTRTEEFENAVWTKTSATVTANAGTAPDGTTTADLLYPASSGNNRWVYQTYSGASAIYTRTVYAKASGKDFLCIDADGGGTNGAYFNLSTGAVGTVSAGYTASITSAGNGWYRCSVRNNSSATTSFGGVYAVVDADNSRAVTASGTNGVLIWGAQLETGSSATAYQRVTTGFDVTEAGVASLSYLSFDGVDDFMITPTITPGIDKAQVFAGVRKLSDAAAGILLESSGNAGANNGALYVVTGPDPLAANRYSSATKGSAAFSGNNVATTNTGNAPDQAVLSTTHDIAGDLTTIRRNGVAGTSSTVDLGTGNFLAYPFYIGRRNGISAPYNGQIYSLIVRFGTNLDAGTITSTETWVNGKTGAYA